MIVSPMASRFLFANMSRHRTVGQYIHQQHQLRTYAVRMLSTNLSRDDNFDQLNGASIVTENNDEGVTKRQWTKSTSDSSDILKSTIPEASETNTKKSAFPTTDAELYGDTPRVSVLMELTDRVGVLHDVLKYFWKYDINITRIESRPVMSQYQQTQYSWNKPTANTFDFYMDFRGSLDDPSVQKLMQELVPLTDKLLVLDEKDVHWFPRHVSELDLVAHRTLDAGVDLEADHPGFKDQEYRERRAVLAENALKHRWDQPIPHIEYTPDEIATWGIVWDRMEDLWKTYACKEYLVSSQNWSLVSENVLRPALRPYPSDS